MSSTLLKTKLRPPRVGARLLHRPRLYKRFDQLPPGGIALLYAPAGFGKTTLAQTWLARQTSASAPASDATSGQRSAWLTLDAQERDIVRFLRFLGAAIKSLAPSFSEACVDAFAAEPGASFAPVIEAMIEALLVASERDDATPCLVIDQLHTLDTRPPFATGDGESGRCHDALCMLLSHWPGRGRVVLCSRTYPPYPLLRWRAEQRLIEIDARQLTLTQRETTRLLRAYLDLHMESDYPDEEGVEDALEGEGHLPGQGRPASVASAERHAEAQELLSDWFCSHVHEQIGGWPAGIQLAMASLEQSEPLEDQKAWLEASLRDVKAYFAHEIFSQCEERVQSFLCGAALLERWNTALCDVALQRDDSAAIIVNLRKDALFVTPLSGRRDSGEPRQGWFRFWPVIQQFLRGEAKRRIEPERQRAIYQRANEWLFVHGDLELGMSCAFLSGDIDVAVSLLLSRGTNIVYQAHWDRLLHWLSQLPSEASEQYPQLRLYQLYIACMRGRWGEADEAFLQRTERLIGEISGEEGEHQVDFMRGQIAFIRAHNARNQERLEEALSCVDQALSLIPQEQRSFRGVVRFHGDFYEWQLHGDVRRTLASIHARQERERTIPSGSLQQIFLYAAQADAMLIGGLYHQAARLCRQLLDDRQSTPESLKKPRTTVPIHFRMGQVLLHWNQLDEAAPHLLGVHRYAGFRLLWREAERYHIYKALLHMARQEPLDAIETFRLARQQQPPEQRGPLSLLEVYQARLWLRMGNLEAAGHWANEARFPTKPPDEALSFVHETAHLTFARVLLAQGEPASAQQWFARIEASAAAGSRTARVMESQFLQALCCAQMEQTDAAWEWLLKALSLGHIQDVIRVFVDEGQPAKSLLLSLLKAAYRRQQTGPTEYIQTIVAAFPSERLPGAPVSESQADIPVELYHCDPLSDREVEILAFAATGEPYRQIAKRLAISPATVKRHMNNIYSKLGVHNRNDAVAFARKMQILE